MPGVSLLLYCRRHEYDARLYAILADADKALYGGMLNMAARHRDGRYARRQAGYRLSLFRLRRPWLFAAFAANTAARP